MLKIEFFMPPSSESRPMTNQILGGIYYTPIPQLLASGVVLQNTGVMAYFQFRTNNYV